MSMTDIVQDKVLAMSPQYSDTFPNILKRPNFARHRQAMRNLNDNETGQNDAI
jgi:hypothetical protein